jgi:hypothetical protein
VPGSGRDRIRRTGCDHVADGEVRSRRLHRGQHVLRRDRARVCELDDRLGALASVAREGLDLVLGLSFAGRRAAELFDGVDALLGLIVEREAELRLGPVSDLRSTAATRLAFSASSRPARNSRSASLIVWSASAIWRRG